jgi:TP901 family phage tail tape measure protein
MAKVELNIVALGDFSSVNTQIKVLQENIAVLQRGLSGVGLSSNLTKDLQGISSQFKQTMLSTGQFTASTVAMSTETERFGTALAAGKLKLGDYYNIIKQRSSESLTQFKALALEQTKLQNSILISDPTKSGLLNVYTPTQIDKVANATKIAANEANLYAMAVNKGSQSLINFGKNTQWAGRQLTVGMSVPILIFGQQAVASFNSVNVELTRLQRLYGEGLTPPSQQELTQISNQVLNLGKQIAGTMGIAQTETVKAAANFAAMGRQGQDLLTTTAQTMRLSKLGAVSTADATNTIVALQNVYKVSTMDLAGAVNFLSDIQKQTTMTLGDMTQAIPRVGPIMQQLGGTYKDTAVMLVAMREAGIPAAQAANALKSAVASMIAPTAAASKEWQQYGINLTAIRDQTNGNPVQMLKDLQQGLQNLSPLVREQLIDKLFGKFQFARVSALLENFGKQGSQTVNALKIANASQSELATLANQEMTQATSSPTAQYQRALQTFKADLVPVGQKIVEFTTKLLSFGNSVAKVFGGLPAPIKAVAEFLAIGTVLAGPIIMLTGLLANFAGFLIKGVFNIKQLVTGGKTLGQLLTPEFIAAQNASKMFGANVNNNVNEIELLSKAIADLTRNIEGMISAMGAGTSISSLTSAVAGVAQSEVRIYEQMKLPGFAKGGIINGPGTGTSDSIIARVSNGETIVDAETTQRFYPIIQAMLSNRLPRFKDGLLNFRKQNKNGETYQADLGHGSEMDQATSEYYFNKFPGLKTLNQTGLGQAEIISKEVGIQGKAVNIGMKRNAAGVSSDAVISDMTQTGPMKWAEGAINGGMPASRLKDADMQKAMVAYDVELKKQIEIIKDKNKNDPNYKIKNKEYYDAVAKAKTAVAKEGPAHLELVNSLNKAAKSYGGFRTFFDDARSKFSTIISELGGQISGTMVKLNGQSVGEIKTVKNADGTRTPGQFVNGSVVGGTPGGMSSNEYKTSEEEAINNARNEIYQLTQNLRNYIKTQGLDVAQFFGTGFNEGLVNTIPELRAVVEKFGTAAPNELKAILEVASPSRVGIYIGKMFGKGVQVGVQDAIPGLESAGKEAATALTNSVEGPLMENGSFVNNTGFFGKLKGMVTKPGGGMNIQSKMAGSTALMMGGSALAGMLPKGSNASNIAGDVSNMAGMGMMFGPWGAAAGAAIGLVTGGIGALMKAEHEHQAVAQATFSASGSSITMFGGKMSQASNNIIHFNDALEKSGVTAKKDIGEINQLANAIAKLPKTDATKTTADAIKGYNSAGAVIGTLKQFAAAQVAAGMDPKGVAKMVSAMLTYAGKTQYLKAALKEIVPATQSVGAAQQTLLAKLTSAASASYISMQVNNGVIKSYKDMNSEQKRLSDGFGTVGMSMLDSSANSKSLIASMNALNHSGLDAYTSGTLLAAKLKDMGQTDLANRFTTINKTVGDTGKSMMIATAEADGLIKNLDKLALTKLIKDPKAMATLAAQIAKYNQDAAAAAAKQAAADAAAQAKKDAAAAAAADAAAKANVFKGTAEEQDAQKRLTANKKAQDSVLKTLKDQLSMYQKQTAELKRMRDLDMQRNDLNNQMKDALISGNYLGAAQLGQAKSALQVDFNSTTMENKMQANIDQVQVQADAFAQSLADLTDAISQGIKVLDPNIKAAAHTAVIRPGAVDASIGASVITQNFVINGGDIQAVHQTINTATKQAVNKSATSKHKINPAKSSGLPSTHKPGGK